jgi:hypothetical protein
MVAWYKADDCTQAIETARWIESNVEGLTSADEKDLDRVTSDCKYREANTKFESGDLDAAAAILEQIDTEDGDVALKVGRLQGKIEERRKAQASGEGGGEGEGEVEEPAAVEPPPSWWRPVGFAGLGVGVAAAATAVTLVITDQKRLDEWVELCKGDEPHPKCDGNDPPKSVIDQAKTSRTVIGVLWGVTGVGVLSGGTLLALHYIRQAKYDEYVAKQGLGSLQLLPMLSPDTAGISLHVRF